MIDLEEARSLLKDQVLLPGNEIVSLENRGIKTVLMSGYTDNVVADRGVLKPGIVFINKPLLPVSLATKLRSVLDGQV